MWILQARLKHAAFVGAFINASVYFLYHLFTQLSNILTGNYDGFCNDKDWAVSLRSGCFRVEFVWPTLLLSISATTASSFAVYFLRTMFKSNAPDDESMFISSFGVGSLRTTVCLPQGAYAVGDNRLRVGITIVGFMLAQVFVLVAWCYTICNTDRDYNINYMSTYTQSMTLVLLLAVGFLSNFARSVRLSYVGLFPGILFVNVGAQLAIGLCEVYFIIAAFQTNTASAFSPTACPHKIFVISATAANVITLVLFSLAQKGPVFVHTSDDSSLFGLFTTYTHINGNAEEEDKESDSETTPLADPKAVKESKLVYTPENNSSWFDKLTFSWANSLLRRGASRQLGYADLYKLDSENMPIHNWKRYQNQRKDGRSLHVALFLTFSPEFIVQSVLAVSLVVLEFAGPFFFQRIIRYIEHVNYSMPESSPHSVYVDVLGMLCFTLLGGIIENRVLWIGRTICIRMKNVLVAELSLKALNCSGNGAVEDKYAKESENDDSDGNDSIGNGNIVNLLTTDLERITEFASYIDDIYRTPLSLCIGIWYIYQLLGISAIIGLSFTIVYFPITNMLYTRMTKMWDKLSSLNDKRITAVTDVLQGIKAIKLFGWESQFVKEVDKHREDQLGYSWNILLWNIILGFVSYLSPSFILVTILSVYVGIYGNTLTAELAFTSITVFNMIHEGFMHLPSTFSRVSSTFVSFERIDTYLHQPQVQDLAKRVYLDQEYSLGFDNANLEWESHSTENATAKDKFTTVLDTVSTTTATDAGSVRDNTQPLESTPLLSNQPLSAGATLSINSQPIKDSKAAFSLKSLDVQFPLGGLSIISGPTGSGKSSLLRALIGDMNLSSGRILLPTTVSKCAAEMDAKYEDIINLSGETLAIRDIAYVAQEAWLRNATIRENILFGEPYDRERYEEVLHACALKPDLRILVAGDMTEIGERGVTLSGGQKQRISLARAVYSSRSILLIDDCLSAVDTPTARHILLECLLRKTDLMRGRTRVLVTHHVSMCLPHAQFAMVMCEGQIQLKSSLVRAQSMAELHKALGNVHEIREAGSLRDTENSKDAEITSGFKTEDEHNKERLERLNAQRSDGPAANGAILKGTLVNEEEREEGHVKLEIWLKYLSACGGKPFWVGLILVIVFAEILSTFTTYWIRIWVVSISNDDNSDILGSLAVTEGTAGKLAGLLQTMYMSIRHSSGATMLSDTGAPYISSILHNRMVSAISNGMELGGKSTVFWLGTYSLLCVAGMVWAAFQWIVSFFGSVRASRDIHRQLLTTVVHASPRFFDTTPAGRITSRFSRDIETIDDSIFDTFVGWLSGIASLLAIFLIISSVIPVFMVVAIIILLLYAIIAMYYLNTSRELKRLESNSMSPLLSLIGEISQGVQTIRSFSAKKYYIKEALNRISLHNRSFYAVWSANRWLAIRIDIASAAVSSICALLIISNLDWIDASLAAFVLSYAMSFSDNMLWAIRNYNTIELNMNSMERVVQYLKIDQEAELDSTDGNKPPGTWPRQGDVHVKDLTVEYVPGVPVLHGISFTVGHGEKIGVVGRTGAGKSTLSLAFLRFAEACKGQIVLDGIDISKIGLEDLRRNITIIPQDPVLFNGTIRFNLDPFDEFPDEIVWDALQRTHLACKRDIGPASEGSLSSGGTCSSMPHVPVPNKESSVFTSLEDVIKANGQSLSLGQKQLVALARALVRRSRLIVMDEATASIDFETDERIQQTIRGYEFANSTVFCIAHRLHTIIDYDRVLVLEKGRVAEFDTPQNLLQMEGGIFRTMCQKSGEYGQLLELASNRSSNVV